VPYAFDWPRFFYHLFEFFGTLIGVGAVGMRYGVLQRVATRLGAHGTRSLYDHIAERTAVVGLVGSVLLLVYRLVSLPGLAARRHTTVMALLTTPNAAWVGIGLTVIAIAGFLLARRGLELGWILATIGMFGGPVRALLSGRLEQLVTPLHVIAGGLWLGTLFSLVVAGIGSVLREPAVKDRRGSVVADLVNAFSPLALASGLGVVAFGVTLAIRELPSVRALWTTSYGNALLVKLALVAVVFALGAWNWRRQRPTLGSEPAAASIRRSARSELAFAALVVLATSAMLSVPKPEKPDPPETNRMQRIVPRPP
jgi:putative copper export protein